MREKELTTIITFATTTQAITMEKSCKTSGFEGRLIPVPREISASCGLAWKCEKQTQEETEKYMKEQKLELEGIYQVLI